MVNAAAAVQQTIAGIMVIAAAAKVRNSGEHHVFMVAAMQKQSPYIYKYNARP